MPSSCMRRDGSLICRGFHCDTINTSMGFTVQFLGIFSEALVTRLNSLVCCLEDALMTGQPDIFSFNAVLGVCRQASRWEESHRTRVLIDHFISHFDTLLRAGFLKGCCSMGFLQACQRTRQDFLKPPKSLFCTESLFYSGFDCCLCLRHAMV